MPAVVLGMVLLTAGAAAVWYGFTDPEGGIWEGLGNALRGDANTKHQRDTTAWVAGLSPATAFASPLATLGDYIANPGGTATPQATGAAAVVIGEARTWIGVPYLFGGNTKAGVDCSGLTKACYAKAGVNLPRVSAAQAATGKAVSEAQAQPGDLVAFGAPVHHVGIYLGAGQLIHAPHSGTVVRTDKVWKSERVIYRRVL